MPPSPDGTKRRDVAFLELSFPSYCGKEAARRTVRSNCCLRLPTTAVALSVSIAWISRPPVTITKLHLTVLPKLSMVTSDPVQSEFTLYVPV